MLATELAPTFAALTLHHVTMHVTSWGATATVDLYLDGGLTPRISYTGNLTFGSTTANIDSLIGLGGNFTSLWCSEQVVSDEDTRLGSVSTGPPNGAGGTDDWTGAYTDVNEITLDTGTAVYVNTAAKDEQFATGGLPSGLWAIKGKKISATCCKTSTSTPDHVALGVFEGGTVSAGTPQAMVTAWGTYNRVMILNPRTSAAWLQAQTTQINLRSS